MSLDVRSVVLDWLNDLAAPVSVEPDSVTFVRQNIGSTHCGFVVTFPDGAGRSLYVIGVARQPDGTWAIYGAGGGTDIRPDHGQPPPHGRGTGPWLNLAGGWGAHGFCIGGRVVGQGAAQVRRAELVTEGGLFPGTVVQGVALFVAPVEVSVTTASVRLMDDSGRRVAEHPTL